MSVDLVLSLASVKIIFKSLISTIACTFIISLPFFIGIVFIEENIIILTSGRVSSHQPSSSGVYLMDFFETQERYRRREMRGWFAMLSRVTVIVVVLWIGWLWGQAEQSTLQAEADLVIYENNIRISRLSNQVQTLKLSLAESKAASMANSVTDSNGEKLRAIIAKKIAIGVSPEQIGQSIQLLGDLINCREVVRDDVAVATPLYAGQESKLVLFEGGLNIHVEGHSGKKSMQNQTWFDPEKPITARLVFLGGQKMVTGKLPLKTIIPAEEWLLKLRLVRADLLGYVTLVVENCTQR